MEVAYATPRLDVRPWSHDETPELYDIYGRWDVARWLGATPKVAESEGAMHDTVERWAAAASGPLGVWAVVLRSTGRPVGTVVLVMMPDGAGRPTEDVEIGWHLHPDHWGHGYATEAASGALQRAWAADIREVYAVVHPGNDASVAVTRRLGMEPLGRTNRWYGVELDAFRASAPPRHQGP
jgi:RimJ/RimL family protein N-acetyltransferase